MPCGPKQKEGRVRGGRGGYAGVRREVAVQFLTLGFVFLEREALVSVFLFLFLSALLGLWKDRITLCITTL